MVRILPVIPTKANVPYAGPKSVTAFEMGTRYPSGNRTGARIVDHAVSVSPEVLQLPIVVTLADAINRRLEVEFTYGGLTRVVQPATLGFHVSTGTLKLRAYMVGGVTRSGLGSLWRLFTIHLETDVLVTDRTFDENPLGYQRDDSHLGDIIAQLV